MTGTTIMAVEFDGGVVVAADSRTSTGVPLSPARCRLNRAALVESCAVDVDVYSPQRPLSAAQARTLPTGRRTSSRQWQTVFTHAGLAQLRTHRPCQTTCDCTCRITCRTRARSLRFTSRRTCSSQLVTATRTGSPRGLSALVGSPPRFPTPAPS
eukprot:COSAG05_NODE_162_length_15499_cov_23.006104_12_plen_155_part_00